MSPVVCDTVVYESSVITRKHSVTYAPALTKLPCPQPWLLLYSQDNKAIMVHHY